MLNDLTKISLSKVLFICFTLISAIPVALLSLWVYSHALQNEYDAVEEKHLIIAHNLTGSLNRYVADLKSGFRIAANNARYNRASSEVSEFLLDMHFHHTWKVNAAGSPQLLAHIDKNTQATFPQSVSQYLVQNVDARSYDKSEVHISGVLANNKGDPVFTAITDIGNGNYLVGIVSTKYIIAQQKAVTFGELGHAAIVDQYGKVLGHPLDQWINDMKDISKIPPVTKMMNGVTGVTEFYTPALDANMIAGHTVVSETGWGVMIPQPVSELYANANKVKFVAILIAVIGICVAALISWAVARYISNPIKDIVMYSQRASSGKLENYKTKINTLQPLETRQLVSSFESMVDTQIEYTEKLSFQANYDSLTSLPNRAYCLKQLNSDMEEANASGQQLTFMIIGLDHFREINDSLGHLIGDQIIKSASEIISRHINAGDTLARIGGDEFALVVPGSNQASTEILANTIIASFKESIQFENLDILVGASIGISVYPIHDVVALSLLQKADTALNTAKKFGGGVAVVSNAEMDQRVLERLNIRSDLPSALENDQLHLVFQPIVECSTGVVVNAEALIRWIHPEKGFIPPDKFISVAESTGLIGEIGFWVLDQALKQLSEWHEAGYDWMCISVNLSLRQISLGLTPDSVKALIEKYKVPVSCVSLEITESLLIEDIDAFKSWMVELKDYGVNFSIDDFGTGYSSLSYLLSLPVSTLKIDRSFISDMVVSERSGTLVAGMIRLSKLLDFKVVAEGVENASELNQLQGYNCDSVQGYYFSKPLKSAEFLEYLAERSHRDEQRVA